MSNPNDLKCTQKTAEQLRAELALLYINQHVAFLRQLVIDTLTAEEGRSVTVRGVEIFNFDFVECKTRHCAALQRGEWGSDVDLRILAALFEVPIVAHIERSPDIPPYFLSHEPPAADPNDKPEAIHVVNQGNTHWAIAAQDTQGNYKAGNTPADGHCAFHAFVQGLENLGLLDAAPAPAELESSESDEHCAWSARDHEKICLRRDGAEAQLVEARNNGLNLDRLLAVAEEINRRCFEADEFLTGHIERARSNDNNNKLEELAGRLAARVAVEKDSYQAFEEQMRPYLSHKSCSQAATRPALFSPAAEAPLGSDQPPLVRPCC